MPLSLYLSNVELLWELVEDGPVGALVLLNDGGDEGDELVPELQVVQPRASVLRVSLGLVGVNLIETHHLSSIFTKK